MSIKSLRNAADFIQIFQVFMYLKNPALSQLISYLHLFLCKLANTFNLLNVGKTPYFTISGWFFFPLKMCSKLKTRYFCQNCYVSMQIQHVKKKNDYAELHGLLHSFFLSWTNYDKLHRIAIVNVISPLTQKYKSSSLFRKMHFEWIAISSWVSSFSILPIIFSCVNA